MEQYDVVMSIQLWISSVSLHKLSVFSMDHAGNLGDQGDQRMMI